MGSWTIKNRFLSRVIRIIRNPVFFYSFLALLLVGVQAIHTLAACNHVSYEELGNATRAVWWLDNRTVYDGWSSNVGWYGPLLVIYHLFGYNLDTARFVRLAMSAVSVFCLASLLRKYCGDKHAWLPLLTLGLSPAFLYFNCIETSNGIDLQLFPICLWMMFLTPRTGGSWRLLLRGSLWFLAMLACLAYSAFLFYLPVLVLLFAWQLKAEAPGPGRSPLALSVSVALLGFAAPFVATMFYLRDPGRWLFDPLCGSGIFRGAGSVPAMKPSVWLHAISTSLADMTVRGQSYLFYLPHVDFGDGAGLLALLGILGLAFWWFRRKSSARPILILAGLLIGTSILMASTAAGGPPGIRRCTGAFAGVYLIVVVVWSLSHDSPGCRWITNAGIFACALLLVHHVVVNPINYLKTRPPPPIEGSWNAGLVGCWAFRVKDTPSASLAYWLAYTKEGGVISARSADGKTFRKASYSEIYSALAGYRRWNGMPEVPTYAHDWTISHTELKPIPLSVDLWVKNHFPH